MNPESLSKMKYVVMGMVVLAVVFSGFSYFSPLNRHEMKKADASSSAKAGESQGEVRVNPRDGLKYVWIPPGSFQMGCSPADTECDDDEKPQHMVTISQGFWLGQTQVTVGAYKRFAAMTGSSMPREADMD